MAQREVNMYPEIAAPKARVMSTIIPGVLAVALIAAIGAAGYFYYQNIQLKKDPQILAQQEAQNLVTQVSRLIVLPDGETPTIATVSDPEKLKDQPFFKNAQVGDKVLIYTNAKKAILYNPSTDKIVEVAPINIGAAPAPVAPQP